MSTEYFSIIIPSWERDFNSLLFLLDTIVLYVDDKNNLVVNIVLTDNK